MPLDPVKNFAKVTVSTGYDASATSIALTSGDGAKLPAPGTDGSFNLVWWNSTDYPDPSDDPNVEIVRCTARSTDTLTVTRAQESTSASTKNTSGKTYKMILAPTKKLVDDITSGTQTFQNKTLDNTNTITVKDANFTIQDDGDVTKQVKFQASSITTGQTRTLTIPDTSTTLVGTDATQTLTNKTLTAPKIANGGFIADANGNEEIIFNTTASAVNEITLTNAATGNTPLIQASGGDTNIDLLLSGKGTGKVRSDARYGTLTSDSDGATVTFNMATSNLHTVTLGGNRTLAVSNVSVGQCFLIRLVQDGTGSRTVTWFSTIKWAGGVAPTLTTTASKTDILGFLCTSVGNYDGFVIGQNL